eukprot:TRINITY_DN12409_c0_g4_i1.p1 TRINITY_DN12409_c0_g4~~TRINITY_DN12409_c0_g4_i1.p1  ORF type:complete len:362 (-),score=66.36 TRINITY_DN12409_c0_g4_i1:204-1289(-)
MRCGPGRRGILAQKAPNAGRAEGEVCDKLKHARQTRDIVVKSDGEWGDMVQGSLNQNVRPHIWYFALSDCGGALRNFTHRLKFEFTARQADESEFSVEMRWMLSMNVLWLVGLIVFLYDFIQRTKKFSKSAGSIHPVIWTLASAMALQFVGQVFHTLHLWSYRSNGAGIKGFEVLSEVLFMLSQVTQTSLLILIGLGYTLLQSRIGELDLMIPLAFMVGVVHIMLVGFGKLKDDAAYKYHENEGIIGWILLVMRLLLYAWFLWAVQSSSAEGSMGIRRFYGRFRAAGSVYFLMYPGVFLITKCFAPYLQHGVMTVGLMLMQMGSNLWLANLFLTRGDYFKVSTLSDSDLPGGCKVGVVKEE